MIIYIVLILSAMNFVWKGGVIESKFVVTRAVLQWVPGRNAMARFMTILDGEPDNIGDVGLPYFKTNPYIRIQKIEMHPFVFLCSQMFQRSIVAHV